MRVSVKLREIQWEIVKMSNRSKIFLLIMSLSYLAFQMYGQSHGIYESNAIFSIDDGAKTYYDLNTPTTISDWQDNIVGDITVAKITTPENDTLGVHMDTYGIPGTMMSINGGTDSSATFNFCRRSSEPLPVGEYTIPGDFSSVAEAISYINTNGTVGVGYVRFNVSAGYMETAPVGGFAITAAGTPSREIIFAKSGTGSNPTFTAAAGLIVGSLTDAVFKLIGADYITIDGFTMRDNGKTERATTTEANNTKTEWGVALLYASPTDGAQHNTIRNCSISLDRSYASSFGIYSNVRHTATNVSSNVDITASTGTNSGNRFYANTISNVAVGIALIGCKTTALMDVSNDIGGTSSATGNILTNWGAISSTSFYSSPAAVSGIYIDHQTEDNISYNTLKSAELTGTSGSVWGIMKNFSEGVPGPNTGTISHNTITVSDNFSSGLFGMVNCQGKGNPDMTLDINDNTILHCAVTRNSAEVTFTGITNGLILGVLNINRNIFSGNTSTATKGGFTGISNTAAALTVNIKDNRIGTDTGDAINFSETTYGEVNAISNSSNATTAALLTITGNDIRRIVHGSNGSSSAVNGIVVSGSMPGYDISFNTFTKLRIRSSGTLALISAAGNSSIAGNKSINNNSIVNGLAKRTGDVVMISVTSKSTSAIQINSNNFSDVETSGYGKVTGIFFVENTTDFQVMGNTLAGWSLYSMQFIGLWRQGGAAHTISNNIVRDITSVGPATAINLTGNTCTTGLVSGNLLSNIFSHASMSIGVAVRISASVSGAIEKNTISGLTTAGNDTIFPNNVMGVYLEASHTVSQNRITDLIAPQTNASAAGITSNKGAPVITNNIIGNIQAASGGSNQVIGINLVGTTTIATVSYNTVFLNASSHSGNFGSSALSVGTLPTVIIRNNIFINISKTNRPGLSVAYRRSGTSLSAYDPLSDNNLFYAPVIYYDGTNSDTTLADFHLRVAPRDSASVTGLPAFLSISGASPDFLRPDPSVASKVESGGTPIIGLSVDIDGRERSATIPDIGAYEYSGRRAE